MKNYCFAVLASLILVSSSYGREINVNVILWFDTEDYLLPADDDAAKRLAELLTERHIRATFKVVGEKARVLEKRGRTDVIEALKKHDIGYHANFHSVHPTPTEYLAESGLLDGIAEFTRREGRGAADVRRIFGVKTLACYGQPGSSWASQAIAALPQIGVYPHGVGCYVDDGSHVGLNDQPFWYENAVVVYSMGPNVTRVDLHKPEELEPGKQKVSRIAENLRNKGGGLISIYYHPCESVYQEFWDGVNFKRGANPPREQWRSPGQVSPEKTEAAFKQFTAWIDHIRTIPGIKFVTASELPVIYADPLREKGVAEKELTEVAEQLSQSSKELSFIRVGNGVFSPADQLELLTRATVDYLRGGRPAYPMRIRGLLGPDAASTNRVSDETIAYNAFRQTVLDVNDFIIVTKRVPSRVFIGADSIPPADYLVGVANLYLALQNELQAQNPIRIGHNVPLGLTKQIAEDTPGLFGGWIIHKEGFRAPKVLEIARLQTWTLKPAVLNEEATP